MGTDIHVVFQKQVLGQWVPIPSEYSANRHYALFAHLADVRNGTGFAGVSTGDIVEPISSVRGLPKDFFMYNEYDISIPEEIATDWEKECIEKGYASEEETECYNITGNYQRYMGDHSFTWVTSTEILNHNWEQGKECGIVSVDFYKNWDGFTPPDQYCGMISGPNIVVADSESSLLDSDIKYTHVRIWWKQTSDQFDYFVNEIQRMVDLHGEFRMVMGFDS